MPGGWGLRIVLAISESETESKTFFLQNIPPTFLLSNNNHIQPDLLDPSTMANKRGTDWPNTQLQNLHGSLKELLTCVENEKRASGRKGRRAKATGKTVQQALDEVQEDLDDVAEHPYNNVHSSAIPGDKRLEPAARGPVRQLHMELKRLVESADPGAHEEKVKEHLKSLVSVLAPSHLESEATAKGKLLTLLLLSVQMSTG